jgi:N-acetylmuramoyl-L-alanine amidase
MAGAAVPPIDATGEDTSVLARTLFGEARGEEPGGQIAVAWVIVNRALKARAFAEEYHSRHPLFGDGTIAAACQSAYHGIHQFSCWNTSDPGYKRMISVGQSDPQYQAMLHVAVMVLSGRALNPIGDCTHYYNPHACPMPDWARGKAPFAAIGHHLFFNDVR